jgi:NADH dehydrogenase
VAGGGPTGVEVSGMFAEMRKNILLKNIGINYHRKQYNLVDGANAVLSTMTRLHKRIHLKH